MFVCALSLYLTDLSVDYDSDTVVGFNICLMTYSYSDTAVGFSIAASLMTFSDSNTRCGF